jgi:hypothetical protein
MKAAAFITATRSGTSLEAVDVEVQTTVENGRVMFDVPAQGRKAPHVVLGFELAELRRSLEELERLGTPEAPPRSISGGTGRPIADNPQA